MAWRWGSRVAGTRSFALLVSATIVAVLVGGGGWLAYRAGALNPLICDGDCGVAYVDPPSGVATAAPVTVPTLGSGATTPVSAAAVENAVAPLLAAPALGAGAGFAAYDLATGEPLWSSGDAPHVPASTTKVLTGFAALSEIAPGTRFATTVRSPRPGHIVLVGGGDPYLLAAKPTKAPYPAAADLTTLAARTAAALKDSGLTTVTLSVDDSLFAGPAASPGWEPGYTTSDVVTPVSALWVDEGRGPGDSRTATPAADAATAFAAALRAKGVALTGAVEAARTDPGDTLIASVQSAPVETIVETMLQRSDNEASEVLLRHVALASGKPATFAGGVAAVREAVERAGIAVDGLVLADGSGLARSNRISPGVLAHTIAVAQTSNRTAGLLAGFPVAGFDGTLKDRFGTAALRAGRGEVRAKTGTLTGVSSMAGVVRDASGRAIAFAVMADDVAPGATVAARAALDTVAAALAGCACGDAS